MQRLALINNKLHKPFPKGKAVCRMCESSLLAVCGTKVVHHWRHKSSDDCDNWSESIGPWHLSWQDIVQPEALEVPMGDHRADIIGNNNTIVELQHSPINTQDINNRELFYENMVWLFDATFRFSYVISGRLAFFSFGRTKHITDCKKKIFLDFGEDLVEIIEIKLISRGRYLIERCHGFGYIRSKLWFIENYLSSVKNTNISLEIIKSHPKKPSPWRHYEPYLLMKYKTKWYSSNNCIMELKKETKYFSIKNNTWKSDGKPFYSDLLNYKDIKNGWSIDEIEEMKLLLTGRVIIIEGKLRVLPNPATYMIGVIGSKKTRRLIRNLKEHIKKGRIPILKESTFQKLIDLGEVYDKKNGLSFNNSYKPYK